VLHLGDLERGGARRERRFWAGLYRHPVLEWLDLRLAGRDLVLGANDGGASGLRRRRIVLRGGGHWGVSGFGTSRAGHASPSDVQLAGGVPPDSASKIGPVPAMVTIMQHGTPFTV